MIKTEIKIFKVVVDNKDARATLICITYKIGTTGQGYGAEFYELITSFNNSELKIPLGSYSFSFQEELRLFTTAVLIAPEGRKHIENWIIEKMKLAYGEDVKVDVSNFQYDNK